MAEGTGEVIQGLYRQFILRDLTAKIVPGLIVGFGAAVWTLDRCPQQVLEAIEHLHGAVIAAGFAGAWVIGWIPQTILDVLKTWVLFGCRRANKPNCFNTLRPDDDGWTGHVIATIRLVEDRERTAVERLAVIKEATGNLAVAIVITLSLIEAQGSAGASAWLVGLTTSIILLLRHIDACRRELLMRRELETKA